MTAYDLVARVRDAAGQEGRASVTVQVEAPTGGLVTAPDIYAWDFAGATDVEASGTFKAGNLQPFIPNTAWVRDTSVFWTGAQSVRQDYPQTPNNVGAAFFYVFDAPMDHFFVRLAYRGGATMPYDDFYKFVRHYRVGFGVSIFDLAVYADGRLFISDNGVNPAFGNPAIQMRNLRDSWNWYEYEVDARNPSACVHRLWVNDALQAERTVVLASPGVKYIQFNGTINSMSAASQAWFDAIGIGTRRMGAS